MNPENPVQFSPREAKNLRHIIVMGLGLVFFAIIAAYIYFGMQLARQPVEDMVTESTPPSTAPTQQDILEALEKAPVASPEMAKSVEDALNDAEVAPSADPAEVLRALDYPTE